MTETTLFLLYSIPLGILLFTLINIKYRKYFFFQKVLCSLCFLILSCFCAIKGNNLNYYQYTFPAFFMCFIGDIFLGLFNGKKRKIYFLTGTLAFLTAHIFFIIGFCSIQSFYVYDLLFPMIAVSTIAILIKKRSMTMGKLKPFVYLYAFFVSTLFWKSIHIFLTVARLQTVCLLIGSFLFMISDLLILFLYFYKKRRWSVHGLNIATYYYGVFFLALSLLYTIT